MKKTVFLGIILVLVLGITFNQCKKDDDCKVVITVKYQDDNDPLTINDTNNVVPKCYVTIGNNPLYADYAKAKGYTDASGEFACAFTYEAILNVEASYTDTVGVVFGGKTEVKLIPGETIRKTIYIAPL